jgi:hypothetical protein
MYKIIGSDTAEYGPVSAEQLRQWIAEGRLDANTLVKPEGAPDWRPLGTVPEFAALVPPAAPPAFHTVPAPTSGPSHTKTNPMAVTGLVVGGLSLIIGWACCMAFVLSPAGIVFSMIGLSQINRNPDRQTGKGLAVAGIILSVLGLITTVLFYLLIGFSGMAKALQQGGGL